MILKYFLKIFLELPNYWRLKVIVRGAPPRCWSIPLATLSQMSVSHAPGWINPEFMNKPQPTWCHKGDFQSEGIVSVLPWTPIWHDRLAAQVNGTAFLPSLDQSFWLWENGSGKMVMSLCLSAQLRTLFHLPLHLFQGQQRTSLPPLSSWGMSLPLRHRIFQWLSKTPFGLLHSRGDNVVKALDYIAHQSLQLLQATHFFITWTWFVFVSTFQGFQYVQALDLLCFCLWCLTLVHCSCSQFLLW